MMHHQLCSEMNDDDEGKTFSVGGWAHESRQLVSSPSRDNVFGKAFKCRHACLRFICASCNNLCPEHLRPVHGTGFIL